MPLAQHLIRRGYLIRGSTTTRSKLELLKDEGILPYMINLEHISTTHQMNGFLDSDTLIINVPPGRKTENHQETLSQYDALIDQLKSSNVSRVIFISSTSVYPNINERVYEHLQYTPEMASGTVLLEIEKKLMDTDSFDTVVLRMSGLVGPNRLPGRFLAGKKNIENGDALVNLIHLKDCIEIITRVQEMGLKNEIFNCCADEHPTRRAFYTQAALKLDLKPPEFLNNSTTKFKIVDNSKIKQALKYNFMYPDPYMMIS